MHTCTLTTHSTTKAREDPGGAISRSVTGKRKIILLRVNLGAIYDYGYSFGAARTVSTEMNVNINLS